MALSTIGVLVLLSVRDDDSSIERVEPVGRECPDGYPVKGNVSESGELIYHEPGWQYYARTWPELCFADADAAADAGYRASEVR